MASKREEVAHNSSVDLFSLQDVLYAFNNSLSEEQAWAVCYQCAQFFEQNPSQDSFRDLYYYGITAIGLSKEGDVKIEVNFSQGSGKGPPKNRSSFSLSREFKTVITPTDVRQALGTAIYKALDFGLSESEEPHLSSDLEALIEFLTDHPTDDDEGIDIERDSDQDIDDSQGREQSEFQDIIDSCVRRLSSQQNAQLHYKAVCRALATEATELVTFLDNIAKGQEKLATNKGDNQPSVDDLERSDWARLWVQIMRELRHGVRLKKVEQVQLLPLEFELTPFEILLEDIRLGRFKLNRIMVNGDIPRKVKDDAHAVILDFIRSRPPLKPANRRKLKERPQEMDPRELLLQDIRQPQTLKPVKHGKVVVRKPTLDCDTNDSSEEESPKQVRKVIKPVAAFQVSNGSQEVSTDDSDSYFSDPEDDYRNHISAPVMSPLDPIYPDADDVNWKRAVTRDLARQPSNNCRSVSRRHTISACDIKSGKKDKVSETNGKTIDNVAVRRSRTTIVRARSRPDVRSKDIKEEEEKHFQFIERASAASKIVNSGDHERARPTSEIDFNQKTRSQVTRAKSSVERPVFSRSVDSRIPVRSERTANGVSRTDSSETENGQNEVESKPKRAVRLSRQSAIRTEGSDIRSKLQSKTAGERVTEKPTTDTEKQSQPVCDHESKPRESRTRRVGVVANERNVNDTSKSTSVADSISKQEVSSSEKEKASRRHEFRQVRPILRSRSEVRPEMKPVKGSHNLPVDFEHNNLDHLEDKHVIIPPPEFRDPDDNTTPTNETSTLYADTENIPDVIKTSRAEFKVVDLLHVSWKTECCRQDPTNKSNPCSDCRPLPSHKWQNPIECLSLTLEEVTHIRCVLTKAELESLITNPELYSQVSKGKVCFTCKKTKFSLFGQWGTKCKFCQRTVCNYCLRKMSVPTEHFEKIPVYTLSPVPLSPEVLEALKVYESTGSVPHSPVTNRKLAETDSNNKTAEEPDTPVSEENKTATRRKSLQRSHTIGVGVGSRPPPNKALLKGPQMSICCDCKTMIMEIIRASRSSVSLITGRPEAQEGDKNKDSVTPRSQVSARSSVVLRPRHLNLEERPRPRSMLDNFKSFNFSKTSTDA